MIEVLSNINKIVKRARADERAKTFAEIEKAESFDQGYLNAIADVKALVSQWLMYESGKCQQCAINLMNDLEHLKEEHDE